jgi:hypothetical protein
MFRIMVIPKLTPLQQFLVEMQTSEPFEPLLHNLPE